MECEFCNEEMKIIQFKPFKHAVMPDWYFAYVECSCGRFIMDRELIEEHQKSGGKK